jgi:gamma-glutamyltranspeptidase/glutathione hydrolase
MFILYWDAAKQQVFSMNGSGRSGAHSTLEKIRADLNIEDGDVGKIPMTSVHAVTVPGAAAGWVDTIERFGSGKLDLKQILDPAIKLGEKGFPVSEVTGYYVRWTDLLLYVANSWYISCRSGQVTPYQECFQA